MTEEPRPAYRFTVLLAMLVLVILGAPILELVEPGRLPRSAEVITGVLFFAMMLSAVNAVATRRGTVVIACSLVGLVVVLWAINHWVESGGIAIATHVLDAVFLGFTITVLFRHLFRTDRVTWNVVAASLCIYLLMIVLWSEFYAIVALLAPSSFKLPAEAVSGVEAGELKGQGSAIALYYSLVTMTTLGYGDIVPT